MATTQVRGKLGEDYACGRLREAGYEVLARNFRDGHREIDIIVQMGRTIAFVEVKTRSERALTAPAEAVSKAQRRRIVMAAVSYLRERGLFNTGAFQPRFDIFEIVTAGAGASEIVRHDHITAAFDTGGLHVFI